MCKAFEELIEQGAMRKVLENVKSLMNRLNLSLEEALDALNVSENERQYILENIDK